MSNKIFVFGTGRCGTVTLNAVMDSVPNLISVHEGILYNKNKIEKNFGDLKEYNKYVFYDSENHIQAKKRYNESFLMENTKNYFFLESLFKKRNDFIKSLNQKSYCDINPYGFMFIDYIIKKYPDAKFVHLVRDGRSVVSSYYNRVSSNGICTSYPDGIPESQYKEWYAGKPRPLPGDRWYDEWSRFNRVQKLSWFWGFVNLEIEKRLKNVNLKNKYFIRLEDFNTENIKNMLQYLEISDSFNHDTLISHNTAKNPLLMWNHIYDNMFFTLNKNLMNKYNYK